MLEIILSRLMVSSAHILAETNVGGYTLTTEQMNTIGESFALGLTGKKAEISEGVLKSDSMVLYLLLMLVPIGFILFSE